mmetsp:Transcript_13041/g.39418  ORF Transcript_13041/g.39418 Transcript_13041/m.39418 type:complete len:1132 (+) Transcript_13041:91-3486(+)
MAAVVTFDVMFRQKQLGLGLAWREEVVVVSVEGAAKRAEVQVNDSLVAIDGVNVRSLEEAYERLRNGARPTRCTFRASEASTRRNTALSLAKQQQQRRRTPPSNGNDNKVAVVKVKCEVVKVGTPSAYPKDAVLGVKVRGDDELGRVHLRGALSTKRAVVAVRLATGPALKAGIAPGDLLIAVDDALVAPPPNAKGVALLVRKCAEYARKRRNHVTTLVFARGLEKNGPELLYTIALSTQVQKPNRRSSFGRRSRQRGASGDLSLLDDDADDDFLRTERTTPRRAPLETTGDIEHGRTDTSSSLRRGAPPSLIARFRSHHLDEGDVVASCWGLELDETNDALVVARGTSENCGARALDVVALLDNRPACAHSLVSFGVAADAAVADASAAGRRAVALTLAHPELFALERRLFVGDNDTRAPPPKGRGKEEKHEDDDDEVRSNASIVLRESWGSLTSQERRRLGEMMRMLRTGLGVEVYRRARKRDSRFRAPRPKPMTLCLLRDCSGVALKPVFGTKVVGIHFADVIGVDVPMTAVDGGVPDDVIAASFYVKYRVKDGNDETQGPATATLDLATESPAIAHKLAESILIATRHRRAAEGSLRDQQSRAAVHPIQRRNRFSLSFGGGESPRPSSLEVTSATDDDTSMVASPRYGGRPASRSHGERRQRVDDAIQRATRRIASVALVTNDASNPKQQWWKTLRRGVVVEVLYADDRTYTIKTPLGKMGHSSSSFSQGQYCRAEVVRAVRSNLRDAPGAPPRTRYILKYRDGPYDCDVAEPRTEMKRFMKGTLFVDVPRDLIVVNMRDQELYLPYSVLALSIAQSAAFLYYSERKPGGVSASQPTIGPQSLHYFLTSDFPQCDDARRQYWRLFTYQFAHIGYYHLAANVFVQIVFGLPVELVHGHWLLFFVYQLGVGAGSLTCSFSDIHKGVVGASGGVYTLIGLHSSDCLVNWRALAQDMRLLVRGTLCLIVPTLDLVLYVFFYKDDSTSYASHIGGWIAGFLFGLAFLQQVSESALHVYVTRPLAGLLLVAYLTFAFCWHQFTYPPKFFLNGPFWELRSYTTRDEESTGSCCWQLQNCQDVDASDYDRLSCDEGTTLFGGFFRATEVLEPLDSCTKIVQWLATHPESEADGFD